MYLGSVVFNSFTNFIPNAFAKPKQRSHVMGLGFDEHYVYNLLSVRFSLGDSMPELDFQVLTARGGKVENFLALSMKPCGL